ncbi:MAG: hypothetical protein FWD68_18615 [Alphaproteobacteria bacterium]|nr:hypothetical protein [Alphaproteobacteria bacterium]
MAAGPGEGAKGKARGFAGLSSLASNVVAQPPPLSAEPREKSGGGSSAPENARPLPGAAGPPQPQARPREVYQERAEASPSGVRRLAFWCVVIFGGLWLLSQAGREPSRTPTAGSASRYASEGGVRTSDKPAWAQQRSRPSETKPSVGNSLSLSETEIRYCLAEDIRIEGARSVLDRTSSYGVDRFNAKVDDYNSRCGNFRYRRGALESARRDIEPYRSEIEVEGRRWSGY